MTTVTRAADARRTTTPNAAMTTLASPTLSASDGMSLWVVEMDAGARGPLHIVDSEQLLTVLDGTVAIAVGGASHDLRAGDAITLQAGVERRITALSAARLLACGHGDAIVRVPGEDAPRGTPPWIA